MMIKKGAMFGLDARIALAIFGALSVISGAALYSAIQDSKATALLADMNEITKAWEAYYLDVGSQIPQSGTSSDWEKSERRASDLVSSSINNWQGPYLSYSINSDNDARLDYNADAKIRIIYMNDSTAWGDTTSWTPSGYCTVAADPCFMWTYLQYEYKDDSTPVFLDEKIDNGDGPTTGKFKWIKNASSSHFFLKGPAVDFRL